MRLGEKLNHGYMLIAVLALMLALMGGAISLLANQHQRLMAERFEQLIETIHRARIWSVHFRRHHDAWPTTLELTEGTEITSYVRDVQITESPTPALRIRLASDALQARVLPFILGSELDGEFLRVVIPHEEGVSDPEMLRLLQRFQPHAGLSSSMLTDLSMQLHDMVSVGAISENALVSIGVLWTEQGTLESAHFYEVNAQSIYAAQSTAFEIRGSQFETSAVHGYASSVGNLTVESAEIRNKWRQSHISAIESDFTTAQTIDADGRAIVSNRGEFANLNTLQADISVFEATDLKGELLMSSQVGTETLAGSEGTFNQIQNTQFLGQRVMADSIEVKQNFFMEGGVASSIGFVHSGAESLFASLHACWFEDQWCRAPKAPTVAAWNCTGCVQTEPAGLFKASVQVDTEVCLHGCEATIADFSGVTTACSDTAAPVHTAGQFECTAEAEIAQGELRQGELQIRLHSGKDDSIYTELPVVFSWRAASTCASAMHSFPIAQSSPAMMGHVTFPFRTSGESVHVQEFGGTCNDDFRTSAWSCVASAVCGGMGAWENIQGNCWCDELF